MLQYHVRELLKRDTKHLAQMDRTALRIQYDDGTVVEYPEAKSTAVTLAVWEFFKWFPNVQILPRHHVTQYFSNGMFVRGSVPDLQKQIIEDIDEVYHYQGYDKDRIMALIQDTTDAVCNIAVADASEHILTLDAEDILDILDDPYLTELRERVRANPSQIAVRDAYVDADNYINSTDLYKHNSLYIAYRTGMINRNQFMQCLVMVGYRTEVDGAVLAEPVLHCFAEGLYDAVEFVSETCSARKALLFSEAPLEDAVYFARRLEILAGAVARLASNFDDPKDMIGTPGDYSKCFHSPLGFDCGTTDYEEWYVRPEQYSENGALEYPGDLRNLIGTYYLDEASGQLKAIRKKDKHLIGQTLKLRTAYKCKHPDEAAVCEVCFGKLSRNVSRFAHLGILCSATMTQKSSQSVLSTKHLDGSALAAAIVLGEQARRYFIASKRKNGIVLDPKMHGGEVKMFIPQAVAEGMNLINTSKYLKNVDPARIAKIESFGMECRIGNAIVSDLVTIATGRTRAVFTLPFMTYLKKVGWRTVNREDSKESYFEIDLSKWKEDKPIMVIPQVEFSYADHAAAIARVIESKTDELRDRLTPGAPEVLMRQLFDTVNSKLAVNKAVLSVLVYAAMVHSKDNFNLSRHSEEPMVGISERTIKARSLTTGYAYESIADLIQDPESFTNNGRSDSLFDPIFDPSGYLAVAGDRQP